MRSPDRNEGGRRRSAATFQRDQRASTSVIATKLLIALVVLLSATTVGYLTTGVQSPDVSPQAGLTFQYTDNGSSDRLRIEHATGETLGGSQVFVKVTGASPDAANGEYRWNGPELGGTDRITSGMSVQLDSQRLGSSELDLNAATIRIIWISDDGDSSYVVDTLTLRGEGGASTGGDGLLRAVTARTRAVDEGNDTYDNVTFVLENTVSSPVTVTKLVVNTTSNDQATVIRYGENCEFQTNRTACALDAFRPGNATRDGIEIARSTPYDLDTEIELPGRSRTQLSLANFEDGNDGVDMDGETVTLTLYYASGGSQTFVLRVPVR